MPIAHQKIDLEELQSLDLHEVVEHKVRQAYALIKRPVIVEDVSLEFEALGRLPGTFIRFYVDEVPMETICRMIDGMSRNAIAKCIFGYYDGETMELLEGSLAGTIADHPKGDGGFGWDSIFIPQGFDITRAEMTSEEYKKIYPIIKPIAKLKSFLESLA